MRYFLFTYMLFMLFPLQAFAEAKRLAILEFRGIGVQDAGLLLSLGDGVRSGLIKSVETSIYQVMTRENTMQILKDMGKDSSCMTGECEVEVARNMGADFVISGTVTQISGTYLVTLKLHNTHTATLLASDQVENKNELALIKQMAVLGKQLMLEGGMSKPEKSARNSSNVDFQGGFSQDDDEWVMEPAEKQGVLSFSSTPEGAVVMIGGKLICQKTPCSKSIELGVHQVNIQKERYFAWEETISVTSSQSIHAKLKPEFGYLDIQTDIAGVHMKMDGKSLGKTPISPMEVAAGIHNITVEDPCYKGSSYGYQAKSGKREVATFTGRIRPRPAGIDVSVKDNQDNDLAAKVYLDGNYLGESPGRFQVGLCSKNLRVEYDGRVKKQTLLLREKNLHKVNVVFERARIAASVPKTSKKSNGATNMEITPEIFLSFAGLKHGDDFASAIKVFGVQKKHDEGKYRFSYLEFFNAGGLKKLQIGYNKTSQKIATIRLEGEVVRDAVQQKVNDFRLDYYGLHRKQIFKIFGKPNRSNSGNHMYSYESNGRRGDVTFICYKFNDYRCNEIYIHWYH